MRVMGETTAPDGDGRADRRRVILRTCFRSGSDRICGGALSRSVDDDIDDDIDEEEVNGKSL